MGVTQLRIRAAAAAIASISLSIHAPDAFAVPRPAVAALPTGPSPIAFSVEPVPGSWRWRWSIRNVSGAPVEVAADRRLVWVEVLPPSAPGAGSRSRRRPRPTRCVFETRPTSAEGAVRTELRANERYSEVVDLRDVCRLRVPAAMAPSTSVVVHYGFEPMPRGAPRRTTLARWMAHTLVPDLRSHPVNDLTATATVPSGEPPDAQTQTADASLAGTQSQAAVAAGLRVSVALRNAAARPLWSLFRPSLFTFEVASPSGRSFVCDAQLRDPPPFREFFVRLAGGARRTTTLALADYCPLNTFDEAGIYRVRAVFRSNSNGEPWLTGRVFTGRVVSPTFVIRVFRGDGRYRPQGLEVSG
jgi:hypothetical protein